MGSMPLTPITDNPTAFLIASAIKVLVFFGVYLVTVALLTLAERKISAWIQDRHGPNRTGPGGLLQPAADGLKNFMKEELSPGAGNSVLFMLAPAIAFCTAMVSWAVIPFAAPMPTPWGVMSFSIADLPVGFIFTLAISSLGVYGITIAGWSSNNKYSLLGGLRSSAQMISYEIAMGLSIIPVLLLAGNVTMDGIIKQQATGGIADSRSGRIASIRSKPWMRATSSTRSVSPSTSPRQLGGVTDQSADTTKPRSLKIRRQASGATWTPARVCTRSGRNWI